jgi:hypothetical protein
MQRRPEVSGDPTSRPPADRAHRPSVVPRAAFRAALWAIGLVVATPVAAQDDGVRVETVRFAPGAASTTIEDTIQGDEAVLYRFGAEAGQTLRIALDPSNLATYFNLYGPGRGPGDEALATGGLTGPLVPDLNRFEGELPTSGEYTISVYMMRSAARRQERSDYALDIAIDGGLEPVVEADFADGLQGGPDAWEVATQGSPLNVRAAPSAAADLRGRVADGATLRNLGCRMAEGRRWCEIAAPDGDLAGWVAGDFLVEGVAPGTAAPSEPQTRVETVALDPDTDVTARSGALGPGEAIDYVLGAVVGEVLTVELSAPAQDLHFNVFAPGGHLLYDTVGGAGRAWRGQVYAAGDHTVQVYHLGDATADYEIAFGSER